VASYTVAAGERGVHNKTLVAATVDTVTFSEDLREIEILSDGAAAVFVTVDGSAPTVAGNNTDILPAGGMTARTLTSAPGGDTAVKLISSGAPTYSVVGLS
jgi:hypothetical protein